MWAARRKGVQHPSWQVVSWTWSGALRPVAGIGVACLQLLQSSALCGFRDCSGRLPPHLHATERMLIRSSYLHLLPGDATAAHPETCPMLPDETDISASNSQAASLND